MACPYTVKQALSIFRQYANQSKDPLAFDKAGLIKALTDFEFVDKDTGAMAQINLLGATEIADEFIDLYQTWLKNTPKSDQMQRILDRTMQGMGNAATINELVQEEIDYMLLFAGTSEVISRGEKLEVALMKMHQGKSFNANLMKENFYATLLNSISFVKGMLIDNASQSIYRKLLTAYQLKQVPDFNFRGTGDYAKTIFNDVMKGGVPINTVMEQELRGSGVFSRSVRASEFGPEPSRLKAYMKWVAFSTKWTQRLNNAPDSVGQTMAMERTYFSYLSKVIDKQMLLNNHNFDGEGEVTEVTPDLIKIKEVSTGKTYTYHLTDASKLRENRLKHSPSAWQQQFQIINGDYTYTVDPDIKVGAKITKGRVATFKLTDVGKAKQMEGQGYYYDKAGATKAAEEMYQKAGITVVDKGPDTDYQINRNSARFKRSVAELERQGRNMAALEAAEKTAIHDFFKNPMGIYKDNRPGAGFNYLEIPNQGVFGGVAAGVRVFSDQFMPYLSNMMVEVFAKNATPQKKEQFQGLFRVGFFGFVNGRNAYAENLMEYSPYGLLKAGLMKLALAKTDKELLSDAEKMFYEQRITDLIAKPMLAFIATGLVFALKFALEESGLCDSGGSEPSLEDVKNGNFVICGHRIPSWMFGMGRTWLGVYNWALHDEKGRGFIALLSFLSGGQYADRTTAGLLNNYLYSQSKDQGDQFFDQAKKIIAKSITDVLALHIPGKGLIGSNSLFFPDKEVEPTLENWGEIFKWATLQSVGMKEAVLSATGEYNVVDYFGRPVYNNPLKYQIGDGVKYDKYDDFINKLSLDGKDLYNGRYRKLFSNENQYSIYGSTPRFMTEKEFHHVQKATGELFRDFMVRNYEAISKLPLEDVREAGKLVQQGQKTVVRNKLNELEQVSKTVAEGVAFNKLDLTEADYKRYMDYQLIHAYKDKAAQLENFIKGDGSGLKIPDFLKEQKDKSIRQMMIPEKITANIPYY